jgi:hypothetical protein
MEPELLTMRGSGHPPIPGSGIPTSGFPFLNKDHQLKKWIIPLPGNSGRKEPNSRPEASGLPPPSMLSMLYLKYSLLTRYCSISDNGVTLFP